MTDANPRTDCSGEGASDGAPSRSTGEATPMHSLDAVFELLANRRRRLVLYRLVDAEDDLVEFEELVESVGDIETAEGDPRDDLYRRVACDLHYWHLPVLDESGVIEYDGGSRLIRYRGGALLERWVARTRCDDLA